MLDSCAPKHRNERPDRLPPRCRCARRYRVALLLLSLPHCRCPARLLCRRPTDTPAACPTLDLVPLGFGGAFDSGFTLRAPGTRECLAETMDEVGGVVTLITSRVLRPPDVADDRRCSGRCCAEGNLVGKRSHAEATASRNVGAGVLVNVSKLTNQSAAFSWQLV